MSLTIPSPSRPVSAAVGQTSPAARRQPPQHRASHQVVTSTPDNDQQPTFTDVYSHPAAMAFAAAHPRRTIPKFGPYLLLQTLGEGEFGKVKLGLHSQWGEEVAVKLIRKGNVENSAVRMSKVEREIEVLRTLKHPNIVRLYDVIETDKYIGIIIEYASGGELFDHILAHRYLRERDASKLFSQLISGVWYIHQKKIVHRDLKLENLLLDRHRNVIITDFGFANRFEHRADDLMQTSCGSPCYAAPELVISEGLYVGSAVDIWSCGVILYAMLAGYLPFDDDPANPDGDNINLLYKYIVNTPLAFPEYISDEARDLLKMMLVPDPRKRASLANVMQHPWLAAYHVPRGDGVPDDVPEAFGRTVEELERAAMEQHQMKRLAYQRQMRAATAGGSAAAPGPVARAQTQSGAHAQNRDPRTRSEQPQPEFLYNSNSNSSPGYGGEDDDPFGPPPGAARAAPLEEGGVEETPRKSKEETPRKGREAETPRKGKEREKEDDKDRFRHTIQIEYDGGRQRAAAGPSPARERTQAPTQVQTPVPVVVPPTPSSTAPVNGVEEVTMSPTTSPSASTSERRERRRRGSASSVGVPSPSSKPLPPSPTSPPTTWKNMHSPTKSAVGPGELVNGSSHSRKEKERAPVMDVFTAGGKVVDREKEKQQKVDVEVENEKEREAEAEKEKEAEAKEKEGKKSRRNTLTGGLTVMVDPIRSIRNMSIRRKEPATATNTAPPVQLPPPHTGGADKNFDDGRRMKASSNKSRWVMDWIRKGRDSLTVTGPTTSVSSPAESITSSTGAAEAASPVQVFVTTPTSGASLSPIVTTTVAGGRKPSADAPAVTPTATAPPLSASGTGSFASRFRRSINVGGGSGSGGSIKGQREAGAGAGAAAGGVLRIHHGAVDQGTITTGQPPEVMRHVKEVLEGMGVEIYVESEFKYRCIRAKQRRAGKSTVGSSAGPQGVAAFTMVGSAASNGVDKRGLPLPSQSSFGGGGGMLRGLLMRRQSSQVSAGYPAAGSASFDADDSLNNSGILTSEPVAQADTVYGAAPEDAGDEVRFSVELTRIDRLNDTYSLDIRRLKGNLRSYKFLYDTLRKYVLLLCPHSHSDSTLLRLDALIYSGSFHFPAYRPTDLFLQYKASISFFLSSFAVTQLVNHSCFRVPHSCLPYPNHIYHSPFIHTPNHHTPRTKKRPRSTYHFTTWAASRFMALPSVCW
ncbi:CAMK/CAMKL/Kin4 protein kinase [Mycena maculata]|uniref:CAMK/CAMKL/Kin4 protein kinase n=1 Tax=Mycena maculata TaxID=230809 RepID=A0AAD7HQ48_9AGAR|nr:CAMK/CAMKL/Kin4 protein kinase [Mycena maculata]